MEGYKIKLENAQELIEHFKDILQQGSPATQQLFDFELKGANSVDCFRLQFEGDVLNVLFANKFTRPVAPSLKNAILDLSKQTFNDAPLQVKFTDVYAGYRLQSAQLGHPVLPPETETPWKSIRKASSQLASSKQTIIAQEEAAKLQQPVAKKLAKLTGFFSRKPQEKEPEKTKEETPKPK